MLPQSLLIKMRNGIGLATLTLAGCSSSVTEQAPTPAVLAPAPVPTPAIETQAVAPGKFPPLNPAQLAELNKLLPDLGSKNTAADQHAYDTINRMGKGALEPLKIALKAAKDDAAKYRIEYLIRYIESDGKYCPPCGMG